ncbi:seryl-tRNA synthetase, partial [Nowakowskiella sp. JEL0078]
SKKDDETNISIIGTTIPPPIITSSIKLKNLRQQSGRLITPDDFRCELSDTPSSNESERTKRLPSASSIFPFNKLESYKTARSDVLQIKFCGSCSETNIPKLPLEILEYIFVLSSNSQLAYVNRKLFMLSQSKLTRSRWLIQKYGLEFAISRCWRWRFMRVCGISKNGIRVQLTAGESSSISNSDESQNSQENDLELDELKTGENNDSINEYSNFRNLNNSRLKNFSEVVKGKLVPMKTWTCQCKADYKTSNSSKLKKNISQRQNGLRHQSSWTGWLQNLYHEFYFYGGDLANNLVNYFYAADKNTDPSFSFTKCALERRQMLIIAALLDLGANVRSGGDMALRTAAKWGHLNLVELLLICGAHPDILVPISGPKYLKITKILLQRATGGAFRWPWEIIGGGDPNDTEEPVTSFQTPATNGRFGDRLEEYSNFQTSLLLQAVRARHIRLLELLLVPRMIPISPPSNLSEPLSPVTINANNSEHIHQNSQHVCRISKMSHRTLSLCMYEAYKQAGSVFESRRKTGIQICLLIALIGKAKPSSRLVQDVLLRAGLWRLSFGLRKRYEQLLVFSIEYMGDEDFRRSSSSLMRGCCEIGSVTCVQNLVRRAGRENVVNVWDGLPLYASVYNGNLAVTNYLLGEECRADTSLFTWKKTGFILGLIFIEGEGYEAPSLEQVGYLTGLTGQNQISIFELTGMAVPSAVTLTMMYRLVPFHQLGTLAKNSSSANSRIFRPHLNYAYYRDNIAKIVKNIEDRNLESINVSEVVDKYNQTFELDILRRRRNQIAAILASRNKSSNANTLSSKENQKTDSELKEEGKQLKITVHARESLLSKLDTDLYQVARHIPNEMHISVPIGDESQNELISVHGISKFANKLQSVDGSLASLQPPVDSNPHTFVPKDHTDLVKLHDMVEFERAGKITGSTTILELGLVRFAVDICISKGFTPILTPDLIRQEVLAACGFSPRSGDPHTYYVNHRNKNILDGVGDGQDQQIHDTLVLTATSEFPLASMYANETLMESQLPLKMVGFGHCFRAEGAAGGFNRGLYRLHQFSKVEMFAITKSSESEDMLENFLKIQMEIFEKLGLCFRVLNMSSQELGAPAFKKYDIEAWMPGRGDWGEISSASNCTDFQSRRLNTKHWESKKENQAGTESQIENLTEFVHTVNGTAVAIPRLIISILETHQQENGDIFLPEALRPYLFGKNVDILKPNMQLHGK